MNNDFIDDIEQYDDEEVDIYGDTPTERYTYQSTVWLYHGKCYATT